MNWRLNSSERRHGREELALKGKGLIPTVQMLIAANVNRAVRCKVIFPPLPPHTIESPLPRMRKPFL